MVVQRYCGSVDYPIARRADRFVVRERNQASARISAKRIRLRGPVQVAARSGESTEMVLGGLVVFE